MNGYFSLCWLRSNKRVCAVFSGVQRVSVSMLWWHQMSHVTELWVPPSRSLVMRQLLPFITDTHHLCLLVTCIVFTWLNIVTIIHFQWARTLVITADSPRVRHKPWSVSERSKWVSICWWGGAGHENGQVLGKYECLMMPHSHQGHRLLCHMPPLTHLPYLMHLYIHRRK